LFGSFVAVLSALVSAAAAAPSVLCIGETLFDGLPSAIYLGGAPLNVACHLAQAGVRARYLSAVGHDRLGTEAVRRLQAQGVDTDLIVQVREAETGFVTVELDRSGDASYTFVTPAAWDFIPTAGAAAAAKSADALVFGSLGMRAEGSRAAIRAAAAAASFAVCDINLRQPFVEAAVVADAARSADLLKLNDEELVPLASMLLETTEAGPSRELAAAALAAAQAAERAAAAPNTAPSTDGEVGGDEATRAVARAAASIGAALRRASSVVVTRGARGAVLWQSTKLTRSGDEQSTKLTRSGGEDGRKGDGEYAGRAFGCEGFVAPNTPGGGQADTVGAGDAFLAALLAAMLREGAVPSASAALEAGCRLGAYVAGEDP
jgi:sugar/nucleoside kinase (ribokinase family)